MNIKRMITGNKLIICTLTFLFCVHLQAQHGTSSPYSMIGVGELDSKTYGITSGMGNTGTGLYSVGTLNMSNPASLAVDSLSFLFDLSVGGTMSQYSNVSMQESAANFNVKKVAAGVRIFPKLSLAFGMLPYSNVQYKVRDQIYVEGRPDETTSIYYDGSGGLSKLFLSGSYKLLPNLNVGLGVSYLFGRINRSEAHSMHSVKHSVEIDKILADFGLMYHKILDPSLILSAGLTYAYRTEIKMKNFSTYTMSGESKRNTSTYTSLPHNLGAGFALQSSKDRSYRALAIDYKFHKWSDIQSPDKRTHYTDSHRINAGVSYIYNYRTPRNYFQRIQYQAGVYYEKTNLIINGSNLMESGITAGMILPIKNSPTQLFFSTDFGYKGGNNLMGEKFVRLNLGVCMNQQWFVKWFYD